MNLINTIPYLSNGNNYEIRVFVDEKSYIIKVFLINTPVNNITYSIDFETRDNFANYYPKYGYSMLIDLVKKDIDELANND
ncbi:MAG TPA: hypothetical protein VIL99_16185 [Ignavibacteria bacterium]